MDIQLPADRGKPCPYIQRSKARAPVLDRFLCLCRDSLYGCPWFCCGQGVASDLGRPCLYKMWKRTGVNPVPTYLDQQSFKYQSLTRVRHSLPVSPVSEVGWISIIDAKSTGYGDSGLLDTLRHSTLPSEARMSGNPCNINS